MSILRASFFFAASAAAACSGRVLDVGSDHAAVRGDRDATAGACAATCANVPTTSPKFSSVADVYTALEGRWLFCGSKRAMSAGADVIGIELGPASAEPTANGSTVGGSMYYLVQGASGPERGAGFADHGRYDVSQDGARFQVNLHPIESEVSGGTVYYSTCPRALQWDGSIAHGDQPVPLNTPVDPTSLVPYE